MSRIGKKPVAIPKGVTVSISADKVAAKGSKGALEVARHPMIEVVEQEGKLVFTRSPVGDDAWHLYDIARDPGETRELRDSLPERYLEMRADYDAWAAANDVLPMPEGYETGRQTGINGFIRRFGDPRPWLPAIALAGVGLLALALFGVLRLRAARARRGRAGSRA